MQHCYDADGEKKCGNHLPKGELAAFYAPEDL